MSAGLFPFALPMRRSWEHARSVARVAAAIGDAARCREVASGRTGEDAGVESKPETIVAAVGSATGDAIIVDEHSYHSPDCSSRRPIASTTTRAAGRASASANTLPTATRRATATLCHGLPMAVGARRGRVPHRLRAQQRRGAHDLIRPAAGAYPRQGVGAEPHRVNPAHINPTVNYEVQRLFSANVGSLAYACSVGPEASGRLFVSATGDQGSRRYIKLVNVGGESVQVTLDVSIGAAGAGAVCSGGRRRCASRTLRGRPQDKRSLEYTGTARGDIRHEVSEYRLSSAQVHVAIASSHTASRWSRWSDRMVWTGPTPGGRSRHRGRDGAARSCRVRRGDTAWRGSAPAGRPCLSFQIAQDAGAAVLVQL